MTAIIAAAVVAAAILLGARIVAKALDAARDQARRANALTMMAAFAPGLEATRTDPRAFLVWQPLARTARAMFPEEFALLDRAAGARFPFAPERLQAAHDHWTAEWLAWESAHDAEFKRRAAEAQPDRARFDAVEREKLETYQRRYEEYVRVSKALQTLSQP